MRPTASIALILTIGLVAAACGGDDATPEPVDEATTAPVASAAADAPTDEPTEAPATEPTEAAVEEPTEVAAVESAEPEFAKKAIHTSGDDAAAVYGLTSGRYRMEWRTTDCESVDILVSQVDGDFSYPKPSKSSYATATINDLPEGTYKIEQLDPACADWSVRIDWMTN